MQIYVCVNLEQKAVFLFFGRGVLSEVLWTGKKKKNTRGLNIRFSEIEPLCFPSLEVTQSNQLATNGLIDLFE